MLKNFDWANPYHHYSISKDGRKLYKAFLPLDQEQVVFIALDYEELKSPLKSASFDHYHSSDFIFHDLYFIGKKISRKTKETEDELWESNQILSSIIEHSPLGVIVFDQDQRIMIWNKSAEMIYGRTASEVEGQFFTTSHQKGIDEQFMKLMRSALKEKPSNIEFSSLRTDGYTRQR